MVCERCLGDQDCFWVSVTDFTWRALSSVLIRGCFNVEEEDVTLWGCQKRAPSTEPNLGVSYYSDFGNLAENKREEGPPSSSVLVAKRKYLFCTLIAKIVLVIILNWAYFIWGFSFFCKVDALDKAEGKAGTCFNVFLFRVFSFSTAWLFHLDKI